MSGSGGIPTLPPSVEVLADGPLPEGLLEAFAAYERALMADDVAELDRLFAPGPCTLRADAGGLLVGHGAIAAFRRGRGGAPRRAVRAVHVRPVGSDDALVVAVVAPAAGGVGHQTQLWHRGPAGWRIDAAQASAPAPAVDGRIWRVVGTPLVPAAPVDGPLAGARVAVKDLFAIAGQRIGGGVPDRLAEAPEETRTAPAVQALLDAGAAVTGIARTDELAYSIAGANPHYGTPPNAAVPGGLPGGSSSGPASAVALGQADIGLGTDTGGSIRVPASYQGLWGLRTTHGAVPRDGLLPLSPTFDTVGWLCRDPELLLAAAAASLPRPTTAATEEAAGAARRFVAAPALLAGLDAAVGAAFVGRIAELVRVGAIDSPAEIALPDPDEVLAVFRALQAWEAWQTHGAWLIAHPGAVRGAVADRFRVAAQVTEAEADRARTARDRLRAEILDSLGDAVLLLPSAAGPAPLATAPAAEVDRARGATLRLTAVAGVAGAPAVSAPLLTVSGAPVGLGLVGAPGTDLALVRRAADLADGRER